ncbi:magnesium chelatase subunit D/magnesium chelatase subunit I [Evansella caseinilytica]|uniref:Magnesium chelatase subunit D/magnesium chelatase subunit I n=1 Tax=Evansella caseinilytica TaxID=1503961 RepID=A0A1H3SDH1_9BACI|nr:AAA family ATPase [Evansella caseinilytica]SDZ35601.1 magnesium chelatase subunit D/magnesium chelatase subunit I [Evansella caseinilytica]
MNCKQTIYPFTALVGQERMQEALILNVINPALGGVLIRGEKGTAKSTAVRALADLFSSLEVVDLPISATEDQVVGSLNMEQAIKTGEKTFEPGLLAKAHKQMLYIDEINLLDDHLVDVLLDAAAMGVNTVEREGISHSHPAEFVLVGTMNPEEGDLRPQLLDRFALSVEVRGEQNPQARVEVVKRRLAFERDPESFARQYQDAQQSLRENILYAKSIVRDVTAADDLLETAAKISIKLEVDGHRADLMMIKTALTLAAFAGRTSAVKSDLSRAAALVLPHRLRRTPFEDYKQDWSDVEQLIYEECAV